MKIPYLRWLPILFVLLAFFGGSSTRCEARTARNWPEVSQSTESFADSEAMSRAVQYLLRARGYSLAVDGAWGIQTTRALRSFQRKHGLIANGVLKDTTWEALVVPVRRNNTGDAVRAVQVLLRDAGYDSPLNGLLGPRTQADVRKYQAVKGRTVDGVVGKFTWCSLVGGTVGDEAGD